jgi:hypothetical protein
MEDFAVERPGWFALLVATGAAVLGVPLSLVLPPVAEAAWRWPNAVVASVAGATFVGAGTAAILLARAARPGDPADGPEEVGLVQVDQSAPRAVVPEVATPVKRSRSLIIEGDAVRSEPTAGEAEARRPTGRGPEGSAWKS